MISESADNVGLVGSASGSPIGMLVGVQGVPADALLGWGAARRWAARSMSIARCPRRSIHSARQRDSGRSGCRDHIAKIQSEVIDARWQADARPAPTARGVLRAHEVAEDDATPRRSTSRDLAIEDAEWAALDAGARPRMGSGRAGSGPRLTLAEPPGGCRSKEQPRPVAMRVAPCRDRHRGRPASLAPLSVGDSGRGCRNSCEIRLLGPFEVLADGTPADVGGSKRQALLAMLALRKGRPVEVDALVDGLWGEELPAAPRNALHHHIARLRAALGGESIVGFPDGYAVKDARVDAVRFEELLAETRAALRDGDVPAAADAVASALALWRGPALQGLTGTAWFGAEARRLEALHVDALEEQFEVALALGEHRELTPALRSALADNPFRERLWGQPMLALYRTGRQADALETFQEARRVLADELGLEPGPELRRLQEAILAHDPAIAPSPVAPGAAATSQRLRRRSSAARTSSFRWPRVPHGIAS